jgi:cellulose synthase/poly-beta-1,6-N-acetylglucosamine synthase-like glycosyltransferase
MTRPYLSVIVPAFNCAPALTRALAALAASDLPRAEWELIVADDGSTDETPRVAELVADRVARVADGPKGPGAARNEGAKDARGDVLVFIDADVCVAPSALRQFAELFRARTELGAAFGAYDAAPEAPGLVSQYRNLLHHYVHSTSPGPAMTFWAGCGAVRRTAFDAAGGFDAVRYPRPQIEDIELGYRLNALGHPILLVPEITGKHLKRWTFRGGVVTDFRDRGVPWMHLILERREIAAAGPLNLAVREKAFTVLAPLGVIALLASLVLHSVALAIVAIVALTVVVAGNAPLLRWFASVRGWRFALAVIPLRLAYYVLNAVSAGWAMLAHMSGSHRAGKSRDDKFLPSRASF